MRRANLFLAAASTALALLIAELALRAFVPEPVRTFPHSVRSRTTTAEYDVEIVTNREGFRDHEHAREKTAGVTRVAVIGDSFVFGSGVPFDSIFPTRLPALLSVPARPVEVINFGVSGTGPVHGLRLWRRIVSRYQPDVVLVCLYAGNDAADALRESSESRPRWATIALVRAAAARARRSLRSRADTPTDPTARSGGWNAFGVQNPADPEALLDAGRRVGVPAESVRTRLAAIPDSLVADALAFRSNPFNLAQAVLDPGSLLDNLLLESSDTQRGWDRIEEALRALKTEIEDADGRMILVCVPAGPQVDARYWWARRLGVRLDDRVLTEFVFQDRLTRFAQREDIELIDLLPAMKAKPHEALYYEQDGHWNARGHGVAARATAAGVQAAMRR